MMNYLHIKRVSQIPKAMLRAAYASIADTVIFQMQDILELDDTARMNEPSTVGTNWRWRMQPGAFDGKKDQDASQNVQIVCSITDIYCIVNRGQAASGDFDYNGGTVANTLYFSNSCKAKRWRCFFVGSTP